MASNDIRRRRDGGVPINRRRNSEDKSSRPEKKSKAAQPLTAAQARKRLNLRLEFREIDKPFLVLVLVLLVFGIVMMFSASYAWGLFEQNDGYYFVKKQAAYAVIGLAVMAVVSVFDYHVFQNTKVAYIVFLAAYGLTLFTAFFGVEKADARRWIMIGPVQFQPSEILKVAFIIIVAYIISVNYDKFDDWKYCTIPFGVLLGMVCMVLALQRHLSAVMLVAIIGVAMMFISGMPMKTFFAFLGVAALGGTLLLLVKFLHDGDFSYISDRIESWRNPLSDIRGVTNQTYNSLVAIGSGGILGLGFGESRQKYLYLSESQNDFIFSVICEELGLVGAIVVILLFALFIWRGFYIASNAKDRLGMLIAAGITIHIGSQALLNMMVASNAFPNTGISLPFFSAGGTALCVQLAEMGIMLSISRQAKKK